MSSGNIFSKLKRITGQKTSDKPGTAVEEINSALDHLNFIGYPGGLEFTSDWRMNKRALANFSMSCAFYWLQVHTIYTVYPSLTMVELVAGFFFTVLATTKLDSVVCNHKKYYSLIRFIHNVYNNNISGIRERILLDTTKTIRNHYKLVFAGLTFSLTLYSVYPFYDFLFNGNYRKISPLVLPIVNESTFDGFMITTGMNIVPVLFVTITCYTTSCLFLTYVDIYGCLVSLVEHDFQLFDSMWEKRNPNVIERHFVFRNILMKIMDIASFSEYMNKLLSRVASIQIASCYFGIATILFGYLVNDYVGGIAGAAFFGTELWMCCYIGQLLENTTTRLEAVMYNASWHTYDNIYQKDLLFALNIIQNVKPIVIADVMPLNFQTGLQVIKSIYSILMFLVNMLE